MKARKVACLFLLVCRYSFTTSQLSGNGEAANEKSHSNRPNVIILLADDLGFGDLSFSGHPSSQTPNIDSLAKNGKHLTNFYVTSPLCSPSRASILTGRYNVRNGVYPAVFIPSSSLGLPQNETTIADILRDVGYRTKIVGKWHLGVGFDKEFLPGDGSYGFDEFYGLPYSHDLCPCPLCFPNNGSCLTIPACYEEFVSCPLYKNKIIVEQPVYLPTLSERFLKESLTFINKSNTDGSPFLLYLSFLQIHTPQFASSLFVNKSSRGAIGDALLEMDWMTGEIMLLLRQLGIESNTFVLFTSDNGPDLTVEVQGGSAGLLRCGKGTTWDGGIHVPAIIYWPESVTPGRSNALVSALDILPTIAKIAGAEERTQNLTIDGIDVSPILLNNEKESSRNFLAIYPRIPSEERGPYAVIYKQYKAHFYTVGAFTLVDENYYDSMCSASHNLTIHKPPLLFDLYMDPGEKYDIGQKIESQSVLNLITEWRHKHMSEIQWMKGRTGIRNVTAQPCCMTLSCEPFPQCCDCPFQELETDLI